MSRTQSFPAIKISNATDEEKAELDGKMFDEFNGALYKYMPSTDAVARGIKRYGKKYPFVSVSIVLVENEQIVAEV